MIAKTLNMKVGGCLSSDVGGHVAFNLSHQNYYAVMIAQMLDNLLENMKMLTMWKKEGKIIQVLKTPTKSKRYGKISHLLKTPTI